jgi:hypothetical protein
MDWRRAALAAATVTATIVLPFALATCSIAVLLHQCPPPLD